jgi:multidrug efflux pump subunit AcrB
VVAGGRRVAEFQRFGRSWPVEVKTEGNSGMSAKDLRRLQIRGSQGQMIPLGTLVTVRERTGPVVLDFLDHFPMVEVTANPAPGESVAGLRQLCEQLANEVRTELGLAAAYRLTWLP